MTRGIGESAVVDALPDAAVVAGAAVTTLGDTWFVFVLLAATYWFLPSRLARDPRRSGATLVAIVTGTLAALTLLKVGIGVPRPPAAASPAPPPDWLPTVLEGWFAGVTESDGFGFPSGHATSAAVTYLGLAAVLDKWHGPRTRFFLASIVVVAVGVSRVVLEVHYLVDILAGWLLGAALLVAGLALAGNRSSTRRDLDPGRPFLAAAFVGVLGMLVAFRLGEPESLAIASAAAGTALGGAVGWGRCEGSEPPVSIPVAVGAFLVSGPLWLLALTDVVPSVASAVPAFLASAIILATPRLSERFGDDWW
ncbi:phosphatase PAP2 family protein [Halopenitus sp. H-Gu1]|uniref:phosphatase PAP2 family protein n=1 Tax=Halopenitus sp. H-Gu1 TaxID=3242697 RepID=UPI00359EE264